MLIPDRKSNDFFKYKNIFYRPLRLYAPLKAVDHYLCAQFSAPLAIFAAKIRLVIIFNALVNTLTAMSYFYIKNFCNSN